MSSELVYVCGPVGNKSVRNVARKTEAGSVHSDDPDAEIYGSRMQFYPFDPGAGEAMKVEERRTCRRAVGGVAESTA